MVAVVDGAPGKLIQRWREIYDAEQARRLPPHTTLCYWVPDVDLGMLERQVRHAFAAGAIVHLGPVREFDNDQHTFYVEVGDAESLNVARRKLYDGTHLELPGYRDWTWHVTCVRESNGRHLKALRAAARDLKLNMAWDIRQVACLELQGDRYQPVAEWRL